MKMYRSICAGELLDLLFNKTIAPRKQENNDCYRRVGNSYVSSLESPFEAVCTFTDEIFWVDEKKKQYIMLELEIPEERILSTGYGIYRTKFFNNHFNDESAWFTWGEYGIVRNSYKYYNIPEYHISGYSAEDVVSVYFMDGCNTEHNFIPTYKENFSNARFSDYSYELTRTLRNLAVKSCTDNEEKKAMSNAFSWYDVFCTDTNLSLKTLKRLLKKQFPEMTCFVNKFNYYKSVENLDSLLAKGKLPYKANLSIHSLDNALEEVYEKDYGITFSNLINSEKYPEKVLKIFFNLKNEKKNMHRDEVLSYIYTLCIENNVL